MRWLLIVIAMAWLLVPAAVKRPKAPPVPSDLQSQVNELKRRLEAGEVARIEILHTPGSVRQMALTPRTLEAQPHYRLVIDDFRASPYREELQKAARTLQVEPLFANPNVRWALIFYDLNRRRILGLSFDPASRAGAVEETSASIHGSLFDWVQSRFGRALR